MEASARQAPGQLDHDARCDARAARAAAGELAAVVSVSESIICPACAMDRLQGEAGASAQREYDRRRQGRREYAHQALGWSARSWRV
jgi:hypothetical protein